MSLPLGFVKFLSALEKEETLEKMKILIICQRVNFTNIFE
jgi:hypothetical protein